MRFTNGIYIRCVLALLSFMTLQPQSASAQADSLRQDTTVFPEKTFYQFIRQNHPIVRQAGLFTDEARQVLMQARGAFDPKLVSHYDRKEFGKDLYYDHWQNKLAVPIWPAGIDLHISYDRNDPAGKYINPEERTPSSGLTGVGLSLPIGRTLFFDARRNAVRQARVAQDMAEAERMSLVNETLYDAAKAYWNWYLAHKKLGFLTDGYGLADQRFKALVRQALLGDVPLIDTTEALITVQDRLVQFQQAVADEQNARLVVSSFLWNEAGNPVELPGDAAPQTPSGSFSVKNSLQELVNNAGENHPELLKLDNKIRELSLEERFRRASLQPQLAATASLISATPTPDVRYNWDSYYSFQPRNYKVGFDLVYPLLLRKERGKLREVQIKNQQYALSRQQSGRDVVNRVKIAFNQVQTLGLQIATQQQAINNQGVLLRGELEKFELGESSLFLVNSRESKLIDLQIKGEELRAKHQQAIAELYYVAGTIADIGN